MTNICLSKIHTHCPLPVWFSIRDTHSKMISICSLFLCLDFREARAEKYVSQKKKKKI